MSEWHSKTLGDFISLQRGYDLPETERRPGNVPVVGSFGITGYHDEARAKGPGVTVGRSGASFGTVYFSPVDFWPHNASLYVTNFHGNDELFVYYFLKSFDFTAYNSGSAQPSLNRNYIYNLPVVVPEPQEQREIAHILAAFDDKIDLNRRMNAALEATARALFQSWFVDFDPVRAKAEGRAPEGMDATTAALFPDSFEDSALGPIPSGWRVGTLGDVAEFNTWTLGKRDELHTIDYIEISEVQQGEIGEIKQYQRGEEPSRARRRLRHGDTVLSTVRPDRGAYFLCLHPAPSLIASTGFAVFTPTHPYWSYVHAALAREEVFERLGALADGAAYPAVAPETIANQSLSIASEAVINAFHEIVSPLYEKAAQHREESRRLAETRDALLPRLISGELRV